MNGWECPKCGAEMRDSVPPGYRYCIHTLKCGYAEEGTTAETPAPPPTPEQNLLDVIFHGRPRRSPPFLDRRSR